MKRIISIMLAFVMLFSVANIAFAQENAEYSTEQAEAEALSADEEYARDVKRDEIIRNAYERYEEQDWDESTLMATYSVKGEISLPSNVKANSGDRVMVQLLSPAVIEDGMVVEEYGKNESAYLVDLTKGATSVNYTASVSAKGDYILAAKYYTGHGEIAADWHYYTKSGSTRNPYLADVISLTSSTKSGIDMTLNASEAAISGTIDLSDVNVSADGSIWIYATNDDFVGGEYDFYCQVPVKKGAKSAAYTLGVPCGNYYLQFSSSYSKYCYYNSNGATSDWDKRERIYVGTGGKTANITLPAKTESGETGKLTVKVDFKADADGDKEYVIRLLDEDGDDIDSRWVTLYDGEDILEAELDTDSDYDGETYIAIKRIYDTDGAGYGEDDRNIVYYSSANGFVGSPAMATDVSGKTSVTVKEGTSVTLKGDYTIEGDAPINTYMYIGAQFEDESFCTCVPVGNGTYQIKVPDRLKGKEYEIFTAQGRYNTTEEVIYTGQTGKMKTTSTTTGPDVSLGEYTAVTGTVYLPYDASENGAVVHLSYNWNIETEADYIYGYVDEAVTVVIEPGQDSVDYKLCVPADADNIDIYAYLVLYEAAEIQGEASGYIYLPEESSADLYFTQSARLTGTISLPYGMTLNEDVELYIWIRQETGSSNARVIIPAGQTSVDYSISVSKGETIRVMEISVEGSNSLVREYYYNGSSFVNEHTNCGVYVYGDLEIDATLMKAACLEVNVTVPDRAVFDGEFRLSAYAEERGTYTYYYSDSLRVSDKGTYSLVIPVPDDAAAEYIVAVNAYETDSYSGNLLLGSYYYAGSDWIMGDDDYATYVSIGDDAPSMTLATEAKANVTVKFPAEVFAKEGFSASVYLVNENGVTVTNEYAEFDELSEETIELSFPDTLTGNVYIKYRVNGYGESNINYHEHYYSVNGPVTAIAEATAVSVNTLVRDGLTVIAPRYKSLSGKVKVDGTYKHTTGLENFSIVLESADGTGSRQYLTANVDENLNYTASYGGVPEGEYYVNYALYSYQTSGTNLLSMDDEVQLTDKNGNRVKVSTAQDTKNTDVEFRAGRAIEGKIKLPSDARVTGELSVNLRMNGLYDTYYTEVGGISEENRTADYIIAVDPEDTGSYPVEVTVYEDNYDSVGGFSNIVLQESYYRVSDTENSDMMEDAEFIDCSRDKTGVDVTLMTGVGIDVSISKPAGVNEYFSVELVLYSKKNGWMLTSKQLAFNDRYNQPGTTDVSLVVPKDEDGEEVYLAYEVNTQLDSLCHSEMLYIAEDGGIHYLKEDAGSFTLGEENTVEFTVAKKDEMDCILESDHPYESGQTYTYEYTHPEAADYLKVYFSDATSIAYNHSIEFRDENGYTIAEYESYNDGYISVPGNSFTLVFDAQSYSYYTNYGFKIIKIEGANYIAESVHPYEKKDLPITYEYTHPDKNVDGLAIHFSSNTYFGDGVRPYIFDEEDSARYIYAGVLELDGRSFRIEIQDEDYGYFEEGAYGFAIEQIVPIYKYTVTFKNYDGTLLGTDEFREGEYGYFYDDDMLVRESDDEDYMYIFTGWDKEEELEYITKDLVVTAQYEKVRAYKVIFKNIDGTVLEEQRVPEGEWAIYDGQTPVYPYETDVNYSFNGWDKPEQAVNSDMVFTATYAKVYLESKHDYDPNSNERFEYSEPGATSMDITFSERTKVENSWDYINIYYLEGGREVVQGSYTGTQLAGRTISIPSDTVVIYLTSDSGVQYYGFAVTGVKAYFDTEGVELDADVTVYQMGREYETVVSLDLNKYIGGTAVIAAYNAEGDCLWARSLVGEAMMNTVANAVTDSIPAEVKVMLWGGLDDMEPMLAPVVKTMNDFDIIGTSGGTAGGGSTPGVAVRPDAG